MAMGTGKGDLLLSGTFHPICLPLAKLKHIVSNMPLAATGSYFDILLGGELLSHWVTPLSKLSLFITSSY